MVQIQVEANSFDEAEIKAKEAIKVDENAVNLVHMEVEAIDEM
jgi:hypothetical protein